MVSLSPNYFPEHVFGIFDCSWWEPYFSTVPRLLDLRLSLIAAKFGPDFPCLMSPNKFMYHPPYCFLSYRFI